jgi:hypothetical protein
LVVSSSSNNNNNNTNISITSLKFVTERKGWMQFILWFLIPGNIACKEKCVKVYWFKLGKIKETATSTRACISLRTGHCVFAEVLKCNKVGFVANAKREKKM